MIEDIFSAAFQGKIAFLINSLKYLFTMKKHGFPLSFPSYIFKLICTIHICKLCALVTLFPEDAQFYTFIKHFKIISIYFYKYTCAECLFIPEQPFFTLAVY